MFTSNTVDSGSAKRLEGAFLRAVTPLTHSDGPGVCAGVFRGGDLVYSYAAGLSDVPRGVPISTHTAFHAASLSKQFTAYAVHLLAAEGRVDLDAPARDFLPCAPWLDRQVTPRHLLHHTSGLRDQWVLLGLAGWRDGDPISTADVLDALAEYPGLNHRAGARFTYSNSGYTLLGRIVESVSDQSLNEFLEARLFRPLGMGHTRFREDYRNVRSWEADCYLSAPSGGWLRTTPPFRTVGATSLQTSVADLASWANMLALEGTDWVRESRTRHGLMANSRLPHYSHGFVMGALGKYPLLSHQGWDYDFSSFFAYLPTLGVGAAVLANGSRRSCEALTLALLANEVGVDDETAAFLNGALSDPSSVARSTLSEKRGERTRPVQSADGVRPWHEIGIFGDLESGDVRRLETLGDRFRVAGADTRVLSRDGERTSLLVEGTLTRYDFEHGLETLTVSSEVQGARTILPRIHPWKGGKGPAVSGTYLSPMKGGVHTVTTAPDGRVLWTPARSSEPISLVRIDEQHFLGTGYVLTVQADRLGVSHPRAWGMQMDALPAHAEAH